MIKLHSEMAADQPEVLASRESTPHDSVVCDDYSRKVRLLLEQISQYLAGARDVEKLAPGRHFRKSRLRREAVNEIAFHRDLFDRSSVKIRWSRREDSSVGGRSMGDERARARPFRGSIERIGNRGSETEFPGQVAGSEASVGARIALRTRLGQ